MTTAGGGGGVGGKGPARYRQSHHTHLQLSLLVMCAFPGFVLDSGFFPRLRRLPSHLSFFKALGGCFFLHHFQRGLRLGRL